MAANSHSLDLESGSTQYAYVADTASLSITTKISMACWVRFESLTGGEMTFLGKYDAAQVAYLFMWNDTGDNLQFYTPEGNVNSSWTPSTATWYHLAVTFDSVANEVKFYVNGAQQGTTQTLNNAIPDTTARLAIGSYNTASTPAGLFDGLIDEVVVTSDILSLSEIGSLYAGYDAMDAALALDNIAGYWKLNNDYSDSSGNSNTLTASGSPVFSTTVPFSDYAVSFIPKIYNFI